MGHVSTAFMVSTLPADWLPTVLFIQPLLQRSERIQNRRRIHLLLPGQCRQRFGPMVGSRPLVSMALELVSRCLALVNGTTIQRSRTPGHLRQRLMKLELQNVRQEIARIGHVRRHMILRARIEIASLRAPAAQFPDTVDAASTSSRCIDPAELPENTRQRHLSIISPKGRNATFSSAL